MSALWVYAGASLGETRLGFVGRGAYRSGFHLWWAVLHTKVGEAVGRLFWGVRSLALVHTGAYTGILSQISVCSVSAALDSASCLAVRASSRHIHGGEAKTASHWNR